MAYWDGLADGVKDPEFLRSHIVESVRVSTIDQLINDLEEARTRSSLSKAELARAIGADSAVIRRQRLDASGPVLKDHGLSEGAAMVSRERGRLTRPIRKCVMSTH